MEKFTEQTLIEMEKHFKELKKTTFNFYEEMDALINESLICVSFFQDKDTTQEDYEYYFNRGQELEEKINTLYENFGEEA